MEGQNNTKGAPSERGKYPSIHWFLGSIRDQRSKYHSIHWFLLLKIKKRPRLSKPYAYRNTVPYIIYGLILFGQI